jgi:hypothetical protein
VFSPQTSGWNINKDDEGKKRFSLHWFEGEWAPQTLEVLQKKTTESEITEEKNDDEEGDDHEDEEESEQESDEDESSASEEEND